MKTPSSIRETFLPDEGCVFVRADLSQVESRMGQMYCGTPRMVELANTKPWEYDAHTENSKDIFEKDTITKIERFLGKCTVHAAWRDMQEEVMSETISKQTNGDLFYPPKKCRGLLDKFYKKNPEIKSIYMPWCRERLIEDGILRTSWGRIIDFRGFRIDRDLYKKVYSFYLQAENADWTNQYGVIPGDLYMMGRYGRPLNMQVHDDIAASAPPEEAYDFAVFITKALEQTREIPTGSGNYLTVPAEITVGDSYGSGVEFKRLPGRGEFDKKVREYLEERGGKDE